VIWTGIDEGGEARLDRLMAIGDGSFADEAERTCSALSLASLSSCPSVTAGAASGEKEFGRRPGVVAFEVRENSSFAAGTGRR